MLTTRNRLAYPAGASPGFNPNFINSIVQNYVKVRAVCVPQGGGFVNLLTNLAGTVTTTTATAIDGVLGPVWKNATSVSTPKVVFTGVGPSAIDANSTFAVFIRPTTLSGAQYACCWGSGSSGPGLLVSTASLDWNNFGGSNPTATITLVVNNPYFLIGSSSVTTCNLLALNLANGKLVTSTSAGATMVTSNGALVIGNSNSGTTNSIAASIGPIAYLSAYLSMQQCLAWAAADPWLLWYATKNKVNLGGSVAASSMMYQKRRFVLWR